MIKRARGLVVLGLIWFGLSVGALAYSNCASFCYVGWQADPGPNDSFSLCLPADTISRFKKNQSMTVTAQGEWPSARVIGGESIRIFYHTATRPIQLSYDKKSKSIVMNASYTSKAKNAVPVKLKMVFNDGSIENIVNCKGSGNWNLSGAPLHGVPEAYPQGSFSLFL